jgi:hypothetical protein
MCELKAALQGWLLHAALLSASQQHVMQALGPAVKLGCVLLHNHSTAAVIYI